MGLRRRFIALQVASLSIVTLGAIGGWGVSRLLNAASEQQAERVSREVDHLAHVSFDLLGAFPNTAIYLLQTAPEPLADLLKQDIANLEHFRQSLDEHLVTSELSLEDAAVHRELETIRLLSVQAEGMLQRTRLEAMAAAAEGRPMEPALLRRLVQAPCFTVMRRHSDILASLHDALDLQRHTFNQKARQARQLGLAIWTSLLAAAWVVGLVFAWRAADRILRPLLSLELLMRAVPRQLPSEAELKAFHKAPIEIASLSQSFRELVNQVQQLLSQLEDQIRTDALTGVGNRRRFEEDIDREWRRALRSGSSLSLLLLDVDHFKRYNDHFGHPQGDACLRQIAAAMATSARRGGEGVYRIGGEEFALLLPCTDAIAAREYALEIIATIDQLAIAHPNSPVAGWVTASIGVAGGVPLPELSFSMLMQRADDALYQRKRRMGRHGVCLAAPLNSPVRPSLQNDDEHLNPFGPVPPPR